MKKTKQSYVINMLWIQAHGCKEDDYPYIYYDPTSALPTLVDEKSILEDRLFSPAKEWAQANPEGQIFIWFDSDKVGHGSIIRTQIALDDYRKMHGLPNVLLRDIQEIPVIRANAVQFSNVVGLYARIDFLKMILCYHCMHDEGYQHAIFSDITPLQQYAGYEALFSARILAQLDQFGIIVNTKSTLYGALVAVEDQIGIPENQFLQFKKDPIIECVLHDLINVSIINITRILHHPSINRRFGPELHKVFYALQIDKNQVSIANLYQGYKDGSLTLTVSPDHNTFADNCYLRDQRGALFFDTRKMGFSPLGDLSFSAKGQMRRFIFPEYYDPNMDLRGLKLYGARLLSGACENYLNFSNPAHLESFKSQRSDIYYMGGGSGHLDVPVRSDLMPDLEPVLLTAEDQAIYQNEQYFKLRVWQARKDLSANSQARPKPFIGLKRRR